MSAGHAWYKRYPADFLHGTSMLSCEEKGAYCVALDLMYEHGGPIPDDAVWIARMCGCSVRKWTQTLRPALLRHGKLRVLEDGRLSNGRMEYETHRTDERLATARELGRRGGIMKARASRDATETRASRDATETRASRDATIIVPINQDKLWNVNNIDQRSSEAQVIVAKAAIETTIIAQINQLQSHDINVLGSETAKTAQQTRANGEMDLSGIYPVDKSAIIETNINEINAPRLADSETQKEKKESKEDTHLRCVVPLQARQTADGANVVVLPTKLDQQRVIFDAWNDVAERCDLPRLMRPGEAMKRKLGALIKRAGIEDVLRAIEAVRTSPWCTGDNPTGWRADFYFLLQTTSFERLLSGFYARKRGGGLRKSGLDQMADEWGLTPMQPKFDVPDADDSPRRDALARLAP